MYKIRWFPRTLRELQSRDLSDTTFARSLGDVHGGELLEGTGFILSIFLSLKEQYLTHSGAPVNVQ